MLLLNENLFDKGYNTYMGIWFSSQDLFLPLHVRRTNACGIVRTHKKNMLPDFQMIKLWKGVTAYQCTNSGILTLV